MKYKENLSTKLLFPQKGENALMTLLYSADDLCILSKIAFWSGQGHSSLHSPAPLCIAIVFERDNDR